MAAPTRVSSSTPALGYGSATSPKSTPAIAVLNGDLLVVRAASEGSQITLAAPTSTGLATAPVWTLRQSVVTGDYCTEYLYTAPVLASGNVTISVATTSGSGAYSFTASVWRDHGGVGASAKTNVASGAPSLSLTTTGANSGIEVVSADWSAIDGTSRTWRTVNGSALAEDTYFRDSARYTVYGGYSLDAGAAGAQTVGLSAPTGQKYSITAVEILGTAGGGEYSGTIALSGEGTLASTTSLVTASGASALSGGGTLTLTGSVVAPSETITVTAKTTGSVTTNQATAYTTASFTSTTGTFLYVFQSGSANVTFTVAGHSLTWSRIAHYNYSGTTRVRAVHRAYVAAGTTGTLTITPSASATGCGWSVLEVSGLDTTTPNDATIATTSGTAVASLTLTLTAGSGSDRPLVGFYTTNSTAATVTPPAGWTELHEARHATPTTKVQTSWNSTTYPTSVVLTEDSSYDLGAIGLRLIAASSTEQHSGSISLSGEGTLTSAVTGLGFTTTHALSGSGTLTRTSTVSVSGSSALSGAGTLTRAGTVSVSGTIALSGAGTLTRAGTPTMAGSLTLSGTGTLTGSGTSVLTPTGSTDLSGTGTLTTSVAALAVSGTRALAGSGTLTGSGLSTFTRAGALGLDVSLSGTATTSHTTASALGVTVGLTGSGIPVPRHSASLHTEVSLSGAVVGVAVAGASLGMVVTLSGSATAVTSTTGSLAVTVDMAGSGSTPGVGTGGYALDVGLAGAARGTVSATSALGVEVSLSGAAVAVTHTTGSLAVTLDLAGGASSYAARSGDLTAKVDLAGSATPLPQGAGGLDVETRFHGSATPLGATTSTLGVVVTLSGSATGMPIAAGTLTVTVGMSGHHVSAWEWDDDLNQITSPILARTVVARGVDLTRDILVKFTLTTVMEVGSVYMRFPSPMSREPAVWNITGIPLLEDIAISFDGAQTWTLMDRIDIDDFSVMLAGPISPLVEPGDIVLPYGNNYALVRAVGGSSQPVRPAGVITVV